MTRTLPRTVRSEAALSLPLSSVQTNLGPGEALAWAGPHVGPSVRLERHGGSSWIENLVLLVVL